MAGLRIKERMAGWISFENISAHDFKSRNIEIDTQYPFEININCYSNKLAYPFPFKFKGDAYFPGLPLPMALPESEARREIEGNMGISHKGVSYEFSFELPEFGTFHCKGAKEYNYSELSWKKYKESLITLPLTVFKNNVKVGKAKLIYLNPLYQFPFGVSPCTDFNAYAPRRYFAKKLMTLAKVLVPDFEKVSDGSQIWNQIQKEVEDLPLSTYLYCRFSLFFISFFSKIRFFTSLRNLSIEKEQSMAEMLETNRFMNLLVSPLANILFSCIYSAKKYLISSDQNIPEIPKSIEDEPWMALNQTPTMQLSKEEIEVDVVIVGSGAGGAAAAYELSRKGHAVAIIEQGQYFKRPDFNGQRNTMMSKLYTNKGHSFALSNSPIWIPTGKCVGGTTTINSGTVIEPPKEVINGWEKDLGLKNLEIEKYYQDVKQMLDAKQTPQNILGGIEKVFKKALKNNNNFKYKPLTRAETGCDGQSYCVLGCPIDAKRSTNVSYVKEALKNNAYLFSRYKVDKILMEDNRAIGVKASLENYGSLFSLTIKAQTVVISAGTFGTPEILKKSGIGKGLKQFGKNLSIHPALNLGGLFNYKVREKFFVPQSLVVKDNSNNNFLLEGYTLPKDTVPIAFINYGKKLEYLMKNIDYFSNFAAMIKDISHGRLLFIKNKAIPSYYLSKKLQSVLKEATYSIGSIFFDAGAKSIYTPISGHQIIKSKEDLKKLLKKRIPSYSYNLSAHHPLGTCRMGSSKENSVVNSSCEVWNTKNLYIADGSVIPGPLGVNPQVTIMSNALRVANIIEGKLK